MPLPVTGVVGCAATRPNASPIQFWLAVGIVPPAVQVVPLVLYAVAVPVACPAAPDTATNTGAFVAVKPNATALQVAVARPVALAQVPPDNGLVLYAETVPLAAATAIQ